MFNFNLHFPIPFFFFLDCYRFFLNLTFLVETDFSSFFLDRYRFLLTLTFFLARERYFFIFFLKIFLL